MLQLLRFLGHDIACPIGYLIDCSAVEELSKKLGATKRTEHFLRWFHHFRWMDRAAALRRRPLNLGPRDAQ